MGDTGDDFKAMRQAKQAHNSELKVKNTEIIRQSGIPFTDKGEAFLFRNTGKPNADFYPSTGRWRVGCDVHHGGAWKFLKWYGAQK